jgi:hypothetical protein
MNQELKNRRTKRGGGLNAARRSNYILFPLVLWIFGSWIFTPPAFAGSGMVVTLPLAPTKPKSGLALTIDGRGIDANGYRPIRIKVMPLPPGPFPADRQLRVVIYPGEYAAASFPKVSQIIELPEGATSAEAVIAIPQTTQWYQFSVETFESGEKLKDLSHEYLGWMTTGYWQWTEAAPAMLIIDERVPPRNKRDGLVATLQTQGADPAPTYDLPDIRTLAWIFPDPNRGNVSWGTLATPGGGSPTNPKLSDTTLLMQVQTQMGRLEMLPIGELPKRWIDLSQFDVTVISADDLKRLAADTERLRAVREWVRGGATLLVYGVGGEFERLAEIEKHLALPPLPADPDEPETYRGWTPADAKRYSKNLNFTADNLPSRLGVAYGPMQGYAATSSIDTPDATTSNNSNLLPAPTKPPFLSRAAGLGRVVAISTNEPFPGKETDWIWIFNCVPNNQWSWYQRNGMSLYRKNDDYWEFLIPGVGQAPVISFLLLVSLFAAIIGPVNYILLGRVRRLYLLLITVPVGAALVTVALFSYAVLTDGLGVRLRTRSFTDLDQTSGQAAGFARQSYYASIAPSRGLEFPEDCTVFGIAYEPVNGNTRTNSQESIAWDGQQKFQSGYITSRTTVQYMVLRSTKSGVRLAVSPASGGQPPRVENRLGTRIRYLLLRDKQGNYFTASKLSAGESATLTAADLKAAEDEFQGLAKAVEPELPINYNPSDSRESAINYLMPNYNYWSGIDAGTTRPVASASLLESNIAVAFRPIRHPYQPGSYIAVLESSPVVPPGVPNPREEASLHVLRGRW